MLKTLPHVADWELRITAAAQHYRTVLEHILLPPPPGGKIKIQSFYSMCITFALSYKIISQIVSQAPGLGRDFRAERTRLSEPRGSVNLGTGGAGGAVHQGQKAEDRERTSQQAEEEDPSGLCEDLAFFPAWEWGTARTRSNFSFPRRFFWLPHGNRLNRVKGTNPGTSPGGRQQCLGPAGRSEILRFWLCFEGQAHRLARRTGQGFRREKSRMTQKFGM